jgi:hypothetical protein
MSDSEKDRRISFSSDDRIVQVVVVKKTSTTAFPEEKFLDHNWHPEETLKVERAKAEKAAKSCLGFGVFTSRGMYSYTYRVYAKTPNGIVEIGACHKDEEVDSMVRGYHEKLGSLKERVAKLEVELTHHDWWCHMSDAPGVCGAGERHMAEIKPLLASLPKKTAKALWTKHAPKEFRFPFES